MSQPGRPVFGIEKISRRYSTPNNWKGSKLSAQNMSKTMSLKFKKINAIRTARTNHEFYGDEDLASAREQPAVETKEMFKTHSRVFRGSSFEKRGPISNNMLCIDSKNNLQQMRKEEEQVQKLRPVYFSSNLQQKMNLYLNGLINRSQQQHASKAKEIQLKIEEEGTARRPSVNLQNLFWRKMKRFNSQKRQEQQRGEKAEEEGTSLFMLKEGSSEFMLKRAFQQ